jgi:putative redox protein
MTVRLYAERRQWPLDQIAVRLKRHPPEGKPTSIDLELILGGNLDPSQTERLREIASRCPVHRALSDGIEITNH